MFMHVCTHNVMGTQTAPIRWNGPHIHLNITQDESPQPDEPGTIRQ